MHRGYVIGLLAVISVGMLGGRAEPLRAEEKASSHTMTLDQLEAIVVEEARELRGGKGQWQFVLDAVPMALLTDVEHDRMRIIAPIIQENKLTSEERKKMLEANFHTALDARYATTHGIVYAAYIHPLSPLREDQIRSALHQVAQLAKTFGTTYSSGALVFLGPE